MSKDAQVSQPLPQVTMGRRKRNRASTQWDSRKGRLLAVNTRLVARLRLLRSIHCLNKPSSWGWTIYFSALSLIPAPAPAHLPPPPPHHHHHHHYHHHHNQHFKTIITIVFVDIIIISSSSNRHTSTATLKLYIPHYEIMHDIWQDVIDRVRERFISACTTSTDDNGIRDDGGREYTRKIYTAQSIRLISKTTWQYFYEHYQGALRALKRFISFRSFRGSLSTSLTSWGWSWRSSGMMWPGPPSAVNATRNWSSRTWQTSHW